MSLLTFGETMLRLTPPGNERLEAADEFAVHVGGAESNVAVAAQRLGLDAAWTSVLPDSPLAARIRRALRAHDVELLDVEGEGRVGTYYLETGEQPRGSTVVYDRDGAAIREATPAELPVDRLRSADTFHTTGITPALSSTLADTVAELFTVATDADTRVSFDVNYRSKLWSPAEARDTLASLLPAVDTLVVAERDAATVFERQGDPATVARGLAAEYDTETVIVTRGSDGAVAAHGSEIIEQPAFETDASYPVGAGDAFVGAYLARRAKGGPVASALADGAATAALARTIPGDMATVTQSEVDAIVAGEAATIDR